MKISFDKMILLLKCFIVIPLHCAKLENIQIMLQNQSLIIPVKADFREGGCQRFNLKLMGLILHSRIY